MHIECAYMNSELGAYQGLEEELAENRLGRKPRILVEGPQGSGKTSLAGYLGSNLGFLSARGFPSGEFLKEAKSQEEIFTKSLEQVACQIDGDGAVFDRSPISQFAWTVRQGGDFETLYFQAREVLEALARDSVLVVVFVNADLESCISRQDMAGIQAIDEGELVKEIEIYRNFYERLLSENIPGLICLGLDNQKDKQKGEFLGEALSVIKLSTQKT